MANKQLMTYYPKVQYFGNTMTNIISRVVPVRDLLKRFEVYFPYVVKEGERADTISFDYYGTTDYTWLIYHVNDIFDPYYQWPLTDSQMFDFITAKYGDYFQSQVTIDHYEYVGIGGIHDLNDGIVDYTVTPATFARMPIDQQSKWRPVTIFEKEQNLNEEKRNIRLLNNEYLPVIEQNLSELFPNG